MACDYSAGAWTRSRLPWPQGTTATTLRWTARLRERIYLRMILSWRLPCRKFTSSLPLPAIGGSVVDLAARGCRRVRKRSSNVERESFSELPELPEDLTLEIDLGDSPAAVAP